jgi:hypothetical protein
MILSPPVINSSTTASGPIGTSFSYEITATNSPSSFAISSGTLPNGLSLNASTGYITGTPTGTGVTSVYIEAINAGGTSTPQELTITITPPTPNMWMNTVHATNLNP